MAHQYRQWAGWEVLLRLPDTLAGTGTGHVCVCVCQYASLTLHMAFIKAFFV